MRGLFVCINLGPLLDLHSIARRFSCECTRRCCYCKCKEISGSAVTRWTGIVTKVGELVDAPTATNLDPAVKRAAGSVAAMMMYAPLPHAAWKKLILEHQVCADPRCT